MPQSVKVKRMSSLLESPPVDVNPAPKPLPPARRLHPAIRSAIERYPPKDKMHHVVPVVKDMLPTLEGEGCVCVCVCVHVCVCVYVCVCVCVGGWVCVCVCVLLCVEGGAWMCTYNRCWLMYIASIFIYKRNYSL